MRLIKLFQFQKKMNCNIVTTEKDFNRIIKFNLNDIKVLKSELKIINEKEFLKILASLYE